MRINNSRIKKFQKIYITGPSGWIGKFFIEELYKYFQEDIHEIVIPISSSRKRIKLLSGLELTCISYDESLKLQPTNNNLLCHFAFLTRDKVDGLSLNKYIENNENISKYILKLVKLLQIEKMLYLSSGAVYRKNRELESNIQANPYGFLKRKDEECFSKIAAQSGIQLLIPRVFNVAGPYINKISTYAISNFIMQIEESREVKINAKGKVWRSYLALEDLFNLCFLWFLDINKKQKTYIFDTVGTKEVELDDLATMIYQYLGLQPLILREYNNKIKEDYYVGESSMQKGLCDAYDYKINDLNSLIKTTYLYLKQINKI
ncbi:MAG: SDR family oxidoreductase [Legionellales bacterium]|nr:SDR family oxidoreductase [Legionellales bacterium]